MSIQSMFRDLLSRISDTSDEEGIEEDLLLKQKTIIARWSYLDMDGSILQFRRLFCFRNTDQANDFLLDLLKSDHAKAVTIAIENENEGNKHESSVLVSVSKGFFGDNRGKVLQLLLWIEHEYDQIRCE